MLEQTVHIGFPPSVVALFVIMVIGFLALDLFTHNNSKPVSLKGALAWSAVWVAVSLAFALYLYIEFGANFASLFLTGYALEKVLSVDNLMVFVAIFSAFSVPDAYRHRILFFGIIGAVLFRGVFVTAGAALYAIGPWVEFVFAAIIVWTAVQMLKNDEDGDGIEDYSDHWSVRLTRRLVPVWPKLNGHHFFIGGSQVATLMQQPENKDVSVVPGKAFYATPLLLCLVTIELADVMFAFDSVPAVIAVTKEPLLVYTAMIFAILGLRQLYFVLEALQKYLVHLAKAIILLLFFIAAKLTLAASINLGWLPHSWEIPPTTSLIIVLVTLGLGVVASLAFPPKEEASQS